MNVTKLLAKGLLSIDRNFSLQYYHINNKVTNENTKSRISVKLLLQAVYEYEREICKNAISLENATVPVISPRKQITLTVDEQKKNKTTVSFRTTLHTVFEFSS